MQISHSGKYQIVFTQDENNHRQPWHWTDENVPQEVADYVTENSLWSDEVKAVYAADHPEPTQAELDARAIEAERQWVQSELAQVDIEIFKLEDGDPRGKADIASWRTYRKTLRNHTIGERPVRPV